MAKGSESVEGKSSEGSGRDHPAATQDDVSAAPTRRQVAVQKKHKAKARKRKAPFVL